MQNFAIDNDIRYYKVKEGWLFKKSKFMKEWRERFIVLTQNFIYSFKHSRSYKDPTEIIKVQEITTIKSYFAKTPLQLRIQSPSTNFYLKCKSSKQKWQWLGSFERAAQNQQFNDQGIKQKIQNRQSSKEVETVRTTVSLNSVKKQLEPKVEDQLGNFFKGILGDRKTKREQSSNIFEMLFSMPKKEQKEKIIQQIKQKQQQNEQQKQVQLKKQKKVQQLKVVNQIQQVKEQIELRNLLPKIIFDQMDFLADIEVFYKIVQFICFLSRQQFGYKQIIIEQCLSHRNSRFFSQALLQMLNKSQNQQILFILISFILEIYQNSHTYFYTSDLVVLINILIRQFEYNRSQFIVNKCLLLLQICIEKGVYKGERWQQLQMCLLQISSLSIIQQNISKSKYILEKVKQIRV